MERERTRPDQEGYDKVEGQREIRERISDIQKRGDE